MVNVENPKAQENWSIRCSACGGCCNSPPLMSVPELFRHQHLFVGALTIRRMQPLRTGEWIAGVTVDAADCEAWSALAEELLHQAAERSASPRHYLLAAAGFDYSSLNRCPALD